MSNIFRIQVSLSTLEHITLLVSRNYAEYATRTRTETTPLSLSFVIFTVL